MSVPLVSPFGNLTFAGRRAIIEAEQEAIADKIGRHEFMPDPHGLVRTCCWSCGYTPDHLVHATQPDTPTPRKD